MARKLRMLAKRYGSDSSSGGGGNNGNTGTAADVNLAATTPRQ
jgi:hypothetical protein